jgi:hypothetical protein
VKSLQVPPANQAFNRIAPEITLDLATRPKDRSSLGPYHPHLIACLSVQWARDSQYHALLSWRRRTRAPKIFVTCGILASSTTS